MRFNKGDFIGGCGDLGVFVPLFIGLIAINGLSPSSVLLLAGLTYILCGIYYKIPIPVQPLKVFASIAIASNLSPTSISAGGILIGIILLLLGLSGIINRISSLFTRPVIKGIQCGIGLFLIKTSFTLLNYEPHLFIAKEASWAIPTINDFINAFFVLVIPQLPVTLGNAIVATKDCAETYFKDRAERVSVKSLSLSMGIANIIAGIAGGMPVCHGSGGLTAHYSFGARTGVSSIFIGSLFIGLSVIFKSAHLFNNIPYFVLGIMLLYVGFKHCALILELKEKREVLLALGIGIIALISNNITLAYTGGIAVMYILKYIKIG